MKKRNLIGLFSASFALTFGIIVGAKADNALEVKADNETTFYLDCTGFAGWDNEQSVCLHAYKSDGNVNDYIEATKVGDNYWYVKKDVTGYTGVEWYRCNSGDPWYHYNKQSWLALPSDNFYYEVGGWDDPGDNLQWSEPAVWSLTGSSSEVLGSYKFDADGFQYYATSVSLAADDVIEFTNGTLTTGFDHLRDAGNGQTAKEKGLVEDNGAGKVKVVTGGAYDIYVNCITGRVWMQSDAATDAAIWADEFLADGCETENTGTKAKWGDFEASYNGLTEGAKDLLRNEEHVEHDALVTGSIKLAIQRYDYVLQRYKVNNANNDQYGYKDFIGRVGSKITLSPAKIGIAEELLGENNSVTVITLVVLTAVAASGLFLLLKKRKEN